jgi:hypothetical protein
MSKRNKTVMKGNSNQSGAEVHQKTMGHIEAVSKAMGLHTKLPVHQAMRRDAPKTSSGSARGSASRGKTGAA